uniref:Uncharacterized protein n=1 Tax=viral metagenome TaxID=1070528 RepID=A0A6H2A420_9ZZZZ
MTTKDKLIFALSEYQYFNRIKNDLDAYLYALGEWALSPEDLTKPRKEDYGVFP